MVQLFTTVSKQVLELTNKYGLVGLIPSGVKQLETGAYQSPLRSAKFKNG